MKRRQKLTPIMISGALLALLIVDTETAVKGAVEGINLCLNVLIPSLFPFFIVTAYMNASLTGLSIPGFHTISKLLSIPDGGDSLFILGLLGGYPVGAQLIADAYRNRQLSKRTGHILLGYCSNAGPAFIFGVTSRLFSSKWIAVLLWLTHIFSSVAVGLLLPRPEKATIKLLNSTSPTLVATLRKSISICSSVCGWVIVFKILLSYINLWLLNSADELEMICLSGLLELSNGCILLSGIPNEAMRFILCTAFLSFGGICVMLQTASVTDGLGLGLYVPGKIMQTSVSMMVGILLSVVLFPESERMHLWSALLLLICAASALVSRRYAEKRCGNPMKNGV